MIPDKNLFIVTSSINCRIGVFTADQRFVQTIESLISVRNNVENVIIMLADVSVPELTDEQKKTLGQYCDVFVDVSSVPLAREYNISGLKSHAENALMYNVLMNLKYDMQLQRIMQPVKRIFKYSGRTKITEEFDISKYDGLFGKFVFKKRIPTWMPQIEHDATHLLITRLFSFCPSLMEVYLECIRKNFAVLNQLDTEHAHFVNIPKEYLVEFDVVGCEGLLAGNGSIERY